MGLQNTVQQESESPHFLNQSQIWYLQIWHVVKSFPPKNQEYVLGCVMLFEDINMQFMSLFAGY